MCYFAAVQMLTAQQADVLRALSALESDAERKRPHAMVAHGDAGIGISGPSVTFPG